MKTKQIPHILPGHSVTCSFCKKNKTDRQVVGHPFGGMTVCNNCFDTLEKGMEDGEMTLGEEQAYRMYGIL